MLIGRTSTTIRKEFVERVEPRIPASRWFEWRLDRRIRQIQQLEARLVALRSDNRWLWNHAARTFSQNGEDGIIAEVLRRLDIKSGFLVEIGAADGAENCTRALVEAGGWSGLWIEADPEKAAAADQVSGDDVRVISAFVTRSNIVGLLREGAVPPRPEVFVIDVDGNDWWVLQEVLKRYEPRVVVLEYNPAMGRRRWVMPYDAEHEWHFDRWYGASLTSYNDLLSRFGMVLVGTDPNGVNAFFVRAEDAGSFAEPGNVDAHFVESHHLLPFGHPWSEELDIEVPALSEADAAAISIDRLVLIGAPVDGHSDHLARVRNRSGRELRSSGSHPVHLAAWWGAAEDRLASEPARFRLPWPVPAGGSRPVWIRLPSGASGELRVELVQEGVRWFGAAAARAVEPNR